MSGLECLSNAFAPGTWSQLTFLCLLPVLLALPIAGLIGLRRLRVKYSARGASEVQETRLTEEMLHAVLWILHAAYFEVCLKVLGALTCTAPAYPGDVPRVQDYPWLDCNDSGR